MAANKPERVDACIIGSGAAGGVAAKVLTEAGYRVVMLERGPWRTKETFAGDELANINRYNTTADTGLNPRTFRETADQKARVEIFCPLPQMVGGATVHWQGWTPRFTPGDFRLRTTAGEVPGTTLVDWPIGYDDLEPYYTKVEWAFGISGNAGQNKFEGPRSKDFPTPAQPMTRYAQKFHEGTAKLGWNSFPTPQAALSRPHNGRPQTHIGGFVQQFGDASGTRSTSLNVLLPAALATGRLDLRADAYVRELAVDSKGRVEKAIYHDSEGNVVEQEADLFIVACGALESARLLLLSRSKRFPDGLANSNDLVGRNATFHEYSAAVGEFEDPIYGWAGGGYIGASTFEFYDHDDSRGFVSGGHVCASGLGIPLPINWSYPNRPTWGAEAKQLKQEMFNHTMSVGVVVHDLPQHDNRVQLDDEVTDAWGLPVARITTRMHENDRAQGRFLIDRSADILEAAGARNVERVYMDRITGNCGHQHGTARMGDDPETSVLDKWCRAHEVDNLFVVDGAAFPTSTGANPTLSIMANSWRATEHIVALGNGRAE
jgi:choline dehydrogenase-like flavoprotein